MLDHVVLANLREEEAWLVAQLADDKWKWGKLEDRGVTAAATAEHKAKVEDLLAFIRRQIGELEAQGGG